MSKLDLSTSSKVKYIGAVGLTHGFILLLNRKKKKKKKKPSALTELQIYEISGAKICTILTFQGTKSLKVKINDAIGLII